jgi:hypothetical protein
MHNARCLRDSWRRERCRDGLRLYGCFCACVAAPHRIITLPYEKQLAATPALCVALCRLLVIVCENKVLLHDLVSKRTQELPRGVYFEGKTPQCVAFMFQVGGRALVALCHGSRTGA